MTPFERGRPTFELSLPFEDPAHRKFFRPLKNVVERLLLRKLDEFYREVAQRDNPRHFIERVLEALNVSYELAKDDLAQVPVQGRLVVLANHPFGMVDGLILASIMRSVRPDFKILANASLNRITELCDTLIHVDTYGKSKSIKANSRAIREAVDWLRSGGALAVFPAGEVSHVDLRKREVTDPEWRSAVARIIRKTKAPALPVFFDGSNGPLFQLAGLVHPRFRTAMLPRELLNKRGKRTEVRIGSVVPFERLARFETDAGMMDYLRRRTYLLGNRQSRSCDQRLGISRRNDQPIAEAVPAAILAREIGSLPPEQTLVLNGCYQVFHAQAPQIPEILREIGRLREISFRAANEGTGMATDLDEFDLHYVHLFLWNRDTSEVVGAYRLGRANEILKGLGTQGLYTSRLFEYGKGLLARISPALELGRSFVRPEYQKTFPPLFLLWKGIAQYVLRHPQYKILFGAVSIANDYPPLARKLIVDCLTGHRYAHELAGLVRAKTPFQKKEIKGCGFEAGSPLLTDIEEVSALISDIEKDRRGIPVLLRQYLKLGGKLLGFSVDPGFSDVLDGLILIDLTQTDRRLLARLMGDEGLEEFLDFNRGQFLLAS